MSATMLRWGGFNGVARLHGISVPLTSAPNLGDGLVWTMDYRPDEGIKEIRPRSIDPARDMTQQEVAAADAILRALTKDVPHEHDPTCGPDHGDPAVWLRV